MCSWKDNDCVIGLNLIQDKINSIFAHSPGHFIKTTSSMNLGIKPLPSTQLAISSLLGSLGRVKDDRVLAGNQLSTLLLSPCACKTTRNSICIIRCVLSTHNVELCVAILYGTFKLDGDRVLPHGDRRYKLQFKIEILSFSAISKALGMDHSVN